MKDKKYTMYSEYAWKIRSEDACVTVPFQVGKDNATKILNLLNEDAAEEVNENFLIVDNTSNTGRIYIGYNDENCALEENAIVYATEEEANQVIIDNGWQEWAGVMGTNYPVNT